MKYLNILFFLTFSFYMHSCAEDANFASGNGKNDEPAQGAEANASTTPEEEVAAPPEEEVASASKCDLTQDFVALKFPTSIQECVDSGNVYDFYTQKCSPIKKAASYKCDFEGIKKAMSGLGIATEAVDDAVAKNAKIIACGEKREGKSLITQWWYPTAENINESDCSFDSEMVITTGCFQQNTGDGTVTEGATPEERSQIIKECLK